MPQLFRSNESGVIHVPLKRGANTKMTVMKTAVFDHFNLMRNFFQTTVASSIFIFRVQTPGSSFRCCIFRWGQRCLSRDDPSSFRTAVDMPGDVEVIGNTSLGPQTVNKLPYLTLGRAVRVSTGAPLPPGADAVVAVEETNLLSSSDDVCCCVHGSIACSSRSQVS